MAADINHVVLVGRLTRDAELKYTANGQAVCKFSIAVNRNKKSGDQWVDEASFFDITLWGRQGEAINQYLVKGKQVGVDGELRQDRWEQDGQKRSKVEIVANNLQLLGGGPGGGGGGQGGGYSGGSSGGGYQGRGDSYGDRAPSGDRTPRESPPSGGGDDGFSDDIPF
ncbi:single-stranded DNA-binding protein [Spirochaetia bacterium]|nr:single-stranded DNA-binding protein [Spirochaetia bacterium]